MTGILGGVTADAVAQASGLRLEERIGSGGAAQVYRAHDDRLDRPVAVKTYHRTLDDDEARQTFDSECRIAARAGVHQQIATIYGAGVADGTPWLAMQLFEGGSLAQRLRSGSLSTVEALHIAIVMAETLQWAHQQEPPVLHRDVKPGNILLDGFGRPTLTDFGIACLFDGISSTSVAAFTPIFAAPEVISTSRYAVTSEVWSLTAVLYQMLTGTSPFVFDQSAGIAAYIDLVRQAESEPRLPGGYPDSLRRLIVDGLAADPARRPASMQVFAQRLRAVEKELGYQPTSATIGPGQMPAEPPTRSLDVVVTPGSEPAPGPGHWNSDDEQATTVPRAPRRAPAPQPSQSPRSPRSLPRAEPRPESRPEPRPESRSISPARGLVASAPIYRTAAPVARKDPWSRLPRRKVLVGSAAGGLAGVVVLTLLFSGVAGAVVGRFNGSDAITSTGGTPVSTTAGSDPGVVPVIGPTATPTGSPSASTHASSTATPTTSGHTTAPTTAHPATGGSPKPPKGSDPEDPFMTLDTGVLPDGTVGVAYSTTPPVTGGTAPYTWAVTSGSLPPGLSLTASTGKISGTPTTAGVWKFRLRVKDARGQTSAQPLSITVAGGSNGPTPSGGTLPSIGA